MILSRSSRTRSFFRFSGNHVRNLRTWSLIVDGRTLSNKTLCQSDPHTIAKPLLKPCKMLKIHPLKILLRQVVLRPILSFKFCRNLFLHTVGLPFSLPFKLPSISDQQIWFYEFNERAEVCLQFYIPASMKVRKVPASQAASGCNGA